MPGRAPVPRRIAWLALALAAALQPPAPALGGAIDDRLPGEALRLLSYLDKHGYKNVGVLKFRVRRGAEPESFTAGPLNAALTTSVENALIVQNARGKLNVLHNASQVAAAKKQRASYLTPEGCDKLFGYDYPLAWGGKPVKADAFVTGVVTVSADLTQATVKLQVLDRQSRQLKDVGQPFSVRADRSLLDDLGQGFVLKADRLRKAGPDDLDAIAIGRGRSVSNTEPLEQERQVVLEVLYNGQKQRVEPHPTRAPDFQMPEPRPGQHVQFRLVNRGKARAYVVLAVNGVNTLYMDDLTETPAAGCAKWVLDPDAVYVVDKFHRPDGKAEPIKVLTDDESLRLEEQNLHVRLGAVELFVFVGSPVPQEASAGLRKALPLAKLGEQTAEAASKLARQMGLQKLRPAGLMAPGGAGGQSVLAKVAAESVQEQEHRVLWYYDRKR